mgnify:CR=1 FL=1
MLGDVLTRAALRDDDVHGARQVILEELAMDDDSPDDVAHRRFSAALFEGHALGRDPAGDREHVEAITPDDVRQFFATHYRAGAMVVTAAGPLAHDEMLAEIERCFAGVDPGGQRPVRVGPAAPGSGAAIDDDSEQVKGDCEKHETSRKVVEKFIVTEIVAAMAQGNSDQRVIVI